MLSPPGGMRTEYCGHIARDPTNETSVDLKEPEKQKEGGRREKEREIGRKREREREGERWEGRKGERERKTKNQ